MADYRTTVDVEVNTSKLDAAEKRIKNLNNQNVNIQLDVNGQDVINQINRQLKNAKATVDVDFKMSNRSNVRKQLQSAMSSITSGMNIGDKVYGKDSLVPLAKQMESQIKTINNMLISPKVNDLELEEMMNQLDATAKKYNQVKQLFDGDFSPELKNQIRSIDDEISNLYRRMEARELDLGIAKEAKKEEAEARATFERIQQLNNEIFSRRKGLVGKDTNSLFYKQEIKSIQELNAESTKLQSKLAGFDSNITDGMFDKLANSAQKAQRELSSLEAKNIDLGIAEEIKQETAQVESQFKKLQSTIKEIQNIKLKQIGMDSSSEEYAALQRRLDDCVVSARELSNSLRGNMSNNMFDSLTQSGQRFTAQIDQAKAKIADLQRATAQAFIRNINNGSLISQLDDMLDRANRVGNRNINTDSIQRYRDDLSDSNFVNMLSSNDAYASQYYERLTADVKDFRSEVTSAEADMKRLNRQIRSDNAKTNFNNQKQVLSLQIDSWLNANSAAAAEFGDRLADIKNRIKDCNDSASFNNLKSEFQQVKLEAQIADKATMTFGDRLKRQAKEYMSYVGIAGAVAVGAEAFRVMAQNVLEVDTAMTGLYRVTDMTAQQYDKLYDDMIASSKEYGTTLTDTINATSDWVRAGFDADTALGLADVTAMYQHVSDLDYDEASENLLTAYNGFKDSFNEEFGGDAVASVEHIADAFNELDKASCPQGTISVKGQRWLRPSKDYNIAA